VRNNLINPGEGVGISLGNYSASANSTDAQIKGVNPFSAAAPSAESDFRPATGGYAIAAGASVPVWADYFGSLRASQVDLGAMKP